MEKAIRFLAEWSGLSEAFCTKTIYTLIGLGAVWVGRYVILRFIYTRYDSTAARYLSRKLSFYAAVILTFIALGMVWLNDLSGFSFATYLGLVSAGVAIALKDIIVNVVGWMYILARRPFEVGDRITIGDFTGDVVDLSVLEFALVEVGNWVPAEQSTGRIVFIPNGMVFTHPIANSTRGFNFVWEDLAVLITFESDWKKAKEIVREVMERHTKRFVKEAESEMKKAASRFFILYRNLTPIVYTSVKDSGVEFSMRYVVPPRSRRKVAEDIWEDLLTAFAEHDDIDLAYPTYRAYYNLTEGKDGARKGGKKAQETEPPPPPAPPPPAS